MDYQDFKKAVEIFNISTKLTHSDLKKKYRKLSKEFHPDHDGDKEKFQNLNKAYEILSNYVENFKFEFDESEFKTQFPLANFDSRFWF
ncbi:MAG: J domain-containing protein [Campylobacter sp.]|nr:J domain-containing protein [Campylobacter sp.]